MNLTSQQATFIETCTDSDSIALEALASTGKCLAPETLVLMADGSIKRADAIITGDYLAGPDSPRLVLSTTQGTDLMYKIFPVKGAAFICNKPHILTLMGTNYKMGTVIDIPLMEVLTKPPSFFKTYKLWRHPVTYWNSTVPCDPYLYGLWLGDGYCSKMAITTGDYEIRNYLERIASTIDHYTETTQTHSSKGGLNPNCWDIQFYPNNTPRGKGTKNPSKVWELFKSSISGGYKNILPVFLTASPSARLALLAGLIDSDGSLSCNGFEISSKDQFLLDDICFLARSLGFAAYPKTKIIGEKSYFRAHISGECDSIPTKIPRKQAKARQQVKDVRVTGIKQIVSLGNGPYAGFTLDGDGRFLLADFTVTHKTFSLQQWGNKSTRPGIATSFSKSTVEELVKKLGAKFPAKTFHALCLAALKGGGKATKLDTSKMYNATKALSEQYDIPFELQGEIRSLACMAKVYGIQPDPAGPEGLSPNTTDMWAALADMYDIEFSDEILSHAKQVVNLSNLSFKKDGLIDFDDMLYCALIYPHRFSRVGIILADEVQDFNLLQHIALKRCLLPNGRVIAAGDPNQAIYAFRGALSNSYAELIQTFSMRQLPLTVSFRCPKAVIKVAQEYVPYIEAAPSNPEGSVLYPSTLSLSEVPKTVLCRNNAPLMRLALRLLVSGRTVEIAGRDIGQNLIKLTERITKKNLSSEAFLDRLTQWKEREIIKYPRRKHSITEKATVLSHLARAHKDLDAVRKHLGKLYPDPKSKEYRPADVHLSTIHKAKGREWPNVLFLDSHLIGKHAQTEQDIQQEKNLSYVAVTRAQRELTFITSPQIEGMED